MFPSRLIVLMCFAMLLLSRCSKSDKVGLNAHMTMKIDGKAYAFNDSLYAKQQSAVPQLMLYAKSSSAGNLQWQVAGAAAGTYSAQEGTPADHTVTQCTVHAIVGSSNYQPLFNILVKPGEWVDDPFEITINSIDDKTVSGTFHGQLSFVSDPGHYATVTEGSFTLPIR